ncbi:unnamed protein product, partial [Ectocarpus sp. 8 AP-2014]
QELVDAFDQAWEASKAKCPPVFSLRGENDDGETAPQNFPCLVVFGVWGYFDKAWSVERGRGDRRTAYLSLFSIHFQIVLALWCPFTATLSERVCPLGGEHTSRWRRVVRAQYRGDRVAIFAPNLARDFLLGVVSKWL